MITKREEIIDAYGGSAALSLMLGLGKNAASRWVQRGIPRIHWSRMLLIASERRILVTLDDLERTAPTSGWLTRQPRPPKPGSRRPGPAPGTPRKRREKTNGATQGGEQAI